MKALVTGATGFIGGALAAALAESGWDVRVLVRPSGAPRLERADRFRAVEAELNGEPARLREAAAGCDVIFHAAAIRNRWGTSPAAYRAVNVEGTRRVLDAAIGQARRFVYVSSVGVLGYPNRLDVDEMFPIRTGASQDEYHRSKALAEQVSLARAGEIEVVVVRPTLTYGPGDRDGMITRLIDLIARGRFLRIGRGRSFLHLTYIDDLVAGLRLAGTHPGRAGADAFERSDRYHRPRAGRRDPAMVCA